MQTKHHDIFTTIRTEGALLPADLLQRVAGGDRTLPGLRPEEYHLVPGEKINEAISRVWHRLQGVWVSFRAAVENALPSDAKLMASVAKLERV